MKWISIAALLFAGAASARSVVLTNMGGGLAITNPSGTSVAFTLQCYNPAGTEIHNQPHNLSPSTSLQPSFPVPSCAAGSTLAYSVGSGTSPGTLHICQGTSSVNFANAESLCDTAGGFHLCTIKEVANNGDPSYYGSGTWMTAEPGSWQAGSSTSPATYTDLTSVAPAKAYPPHNYSDECKQSGATSHGYCNATSISSVFQHSYCCANFDVSNPASYCKVTITTTDPNAYLTSPWFKGGAPF